MSDSNVIESNLPCHDCGSSDALAKYDDGHSYCFSCEKHTPGDRKGDDGPGEDWFDNPDPQEMALFEEPGPFLVDTGEARALGNRRINQWVCEHFGYTTSRHQGEPVQLANYYKDGLLVGQKARFANKRFQIYGKLPGLYGEHLFKGSSKRLVITEGEIDALSVFQALAGQKRSAWPVVSLPNGAAAAEKAIRQSLEFVNSFEEVVLMFDQDEHGQKAAQAVAKLLAPGKAHIAHLPLKDANEMLQADRTAELSRACWEAKPYRPDGIVAASSLWDKVRKSTQVESIPYPFKALNAMTRGIRKKELVTITSGTGMGKSTLTREIACDLLSKGKRVGMLMLEEDTADTMRSLMGIHLSKPLMVERNSATEEEQKAAFEAISPNLFLYDHFGSLNFDKLLNILRHLAQGNNCEYIIFDHLSIAIAALSSGNERKEIDILVTTLRTIVQETGVGLIMVSHLSRQDGRPHEEGGRISLSHLRGSHSIAQISDMVIGLERNQQAKEGSNIVTARVLKNRFSGQTGESGYMSFDMETGRLSDFDPDARPEQKQGASTPEDPTNDEDDY